MSILPLFILLSVSFKIQNNWFLLPKNFSAFLQLRLTDERTKIKIALASMDTTLSQKKSRASQENWVDHKVLALPQDSGSHSWDSALADFSTLPLANVTKNQETV